MKNKAEEIDSDYKLIPMADIDDEARKIAVRWVEDLQDAGGIAIRQKHKLASDIMNYARRKQQDGWISKERSCPCLYLKEPCQPRCTCVNGLSSHGCLNCCAYGSMEQRTNKANKLNNYRLSNIPNPQQ